MNPTWPAAPQASGCLSRAWCSGRGRAVTRRPQDSRHFPGLAPRELGRGWPGLALGLLIFLIPWWGRGGGGRSSLYRAKRGGVQPTANICFLCLELGMTCQGSCIQSPPGAPTRLQLHLHPILSPGQARGAAHSHLLPTFHPPQGEASLSKPSLPLPACPSVPGMGLLGAHPELPSVYFFLHRRGGCLCILSLP